MIAFRLVMFVLAAICFIVAAVIGSVPSGNPRVSRVNLVALGLFFWVFTAVVQTFDQLD